MIAFRSKEFKITCKNNEIEREFY